MVFVHVWEANLPNSGSCIDMAVGHGGTEPPTCLGTASWYACTIALVAPAHIQRDEPLH